MEYYQKIKKEFINNNTNKEVKEYYRNINDLQVYYNVGKLLSIELSKSNLEAKELIKEYSQKLTEEIGKGYNWYNLYRMLEYYNLLNTNKELQNLPSKLSWTHFSILIDLKDINKRKKYIYEWYELVKIHDKIILPYQYISNTDYSIEKVDEWIKINVQLANEALSIVDKSKEKYIMISINLNHLVLQKEKILSYYSTLNGDGFIVQVSEMKQLNEQTISAYINFMKELQDSTNKPVIALKVPVTLGLGLIAKGIHGFSTGIASIEFFDEQYIKDETDPYNMYAKYYFPKLMSFYTYQRKDQYSFLPLYEHFGKCDCKYCKDKEWIDISSGDINIQLHFLEQMRIEVKKLNSFIDEKEKLEYYKERLRNAIEAYTNIPKEIASDKSNKATVKLIKNILKVL